MRLHYQLLPHVNILIVNVNTEIPSPITFFHSFLTGTTCVFIPTYSMNVGEAPVSFDPMNI